MVVQIIRSGETAGKMGGGQVDDVGQLGWVRGREKRWTV